MKVNGQIQLYPVLRIVLFFAIGIILGVELFGHISSKLWYVAFIISLVLAVVVKGYSIAQTVVLFMACLCLGGCLAERELSSVRVDAPDGEVCYEAVVVSPLEEAGKVMRCDLLITNWPRPVKIRASIFKDARAERLEPGNGLRVRSKLEKPASFAGSTFDYGRYLLFHGYSFTTFLYVDDWSGDVVSFERLSLVDRSKIKALQLRGKLLDNFKKLGIDGQDYAVLAAMTLGERVSMSKEMTDDYSASGALHILSLSGMHLGIIYAMLLLLFFKRRSSVIVQVIIVTAVWAYVFIAGLPVSAVRSAVMLSVCSFVNLLNRFRACCKSVEFIRRGLSDVVHVGNVHYCFLSGVLLCHAATHKEHLHRELYLADDGGFIVCPVRRSSFSGVVFRPVFLLFPVGKFRRHSIVRRYSLRSGVYHVVCMAAVAARHIVRYCCQGC